MQRLQRHAAQRFGIEHKVAGRTRAARQLDRNAGMSPRKLHDKPAEATEVIRFARWWQRRLTEDRL